MQSETRWSDPPPDCMLTSALVNVLANAIVSGEQEKDPIVARLVHALGRNWRWIRPLAGRYLEAFHGRLRPRRREVVSFLRLDRGLGEAVHRYRHQIKIVQRMVGQQSMQPVAAAGSWPIPRIETIGALADWLELDPPDLGWFADLKALGYKRPQSRLEHYHYRLLTKANGSIRLIEIPKPRLKNLQRRILAAILDNIPSHPAVHGFVKGRSHFREHLAGRIGFVESINTEKGRRLRAIFDQIDWE
jgi:RNA-directed DNA polymerase